MIGQNFLDTLKSSVISLGNSLPKANNPMEAAKNILSKTSIWAKPNTSSNLLNTLKVSQPQYRTGLTETMPKFQVNQNAMSTIGNKKLFGQVSPITGNIVSDNSIGGMSTRLLKTLTVSNAKSAINTTNDKIAGIGGVVGSAFLQPFTGGKQNYTLGDVGQNFGKSSWTLISAIPDFTLRASESVGITLANKITGAKIKEIKPFNFAGLLQDENVKSLGYRTELEKAREENEGIILGIKVPKSLSSLTSGGLVLASTALDLTGFGGSEKGFLKVLAKEKNVVRIEEMLKGAKVQDDIAKAYAPIIAKMTKEEEVSKAYRSIERIQLGTTYVDKEKALAEGSRALQFDATEYVKSKVVAEKAARGSMTLKEKAGKLVDDVKVKFIDSASPIKDVFNSSIKNTKDYIPTKDIIHQISNVKRSAKQAEMFKKTTGFEDVIRGVEDLEEFDQYLKAKHSLTLTSKGIETGRNVVDDSKLIEAFKTKYEEQAQKIYDYTNKLLDISVGDGEHGIITKETAEYLKKEYPTYVDFSRIFDETEEAITHGGTRGIASLSKQTVVKKLQGSKREIENTLVSLSNKTNKVFYQVNKNNAASTLIDYEKVADNPFGLKALRTSEDVLRRMDIWSELAELKPIKNDLKRLLVTRNKWARQIQSELNKLNKQGIEQYLKRGEEEGSIQKRVVVEVKPTYARPTFKGDTEEFKQTVQTGVTHTVKEVELSTKEVKQLISSLVEETPDKIAAIKKKIANREPKLAEVLDDISNIKGDLDVIQARRMDLFDEAKLIKDAESRGKATISRIRNGVKEIYETTPEIANAAKSMGVQQLGSLLKILAIPTRIARVGISGIEPVFTLANIAKDQLTAFINSDKALRSSMANPKVFLGSLYDVIGHGEEYQKMVLSGASGTAFDLSREQIAKGLKEIRAERSIASNIKYKVTHPDAMFRAVEDIFSRSEELTRTMQYKGSMQASIKKGLTEEEARATAARAFNENTVDFMNSGEWGASLNAMVLYFGASVQGTRTFVRTVKNKPVQTAVKLGVAVYTPVALTTAWNIGSPDRKAAYDDITEYEKESNFILIPPNPTKDENGKWNVIEIPISQEVASVANVMRKSIEQMHGMNPVSTSDLFNALTGSVLPINPVKIEGGKLGLNTGELMSTLTPQAIRPTVEAYANKNFYSGYNIVSDKLSKLSPELQVKDNTSGSARIVGKALNVSPIQVEEWIKSTGGKTASYLINASDRVLAGLNVIPEEQIGGKTISSAFLDRFSRASGGALEDVDNKEMQDILQDQTDSTFIKKQEAEVIYSELKTMSNQDANNKLKSIYDTDKDMYEKITTINKEEKQNLDYGDRLMLQMQVENGTRAKFIYAKVKEIKGSDAKNAYLKTLYDKGILSKEVNNQIAYLASQNY